MAEPNVAQLFARADDLRVRLLKAAIDFLEKYNLRSLHVSLVCLIAAAVVGLTVAIGQLTWGAILFVITCGLGHLAREYQRDSGERARLIEGPVTTTLMEGFVYAGLAAHLAAANSSILAALLVIALVAHTLATFLANEAERHARSVSLWWTSSMITALIIALFLFLNQVVILILLLATLKACACVYLLLETSDIGEQRHEDD